ncbi:MAG TPA: hypothetical protein PK637_18735 [Flavobacteriales bacterium]|nr:hypothetical protein [Flavobacteriales bacterium]HRE98806.1 hypothetical protein [Flavobacteriales bacterium]
MTDAEEYIAVREEITVEGFFKATFYVNDVLEIFFDHSVEIVETIHLQKIQEVAGKLGGGKKLNLLFHMHEFLHTSPEGSKFATSEEGVRFSNMIAVIVDNLPKRILMNFFVTFHKPKVPTRGVKSKKDAFDWFLKYK